jgi:hypothetical protein
MKPTEQKIRECVRPGCEHDKEPTLAYLEWHADAMKRRTAGEKQSFCHECGKYVWDSSWHRGDLPWCPNCNSRTAHQINGIGMWICQKCKCDNTRPNAEILSRHFASPQPDKTLEEVAELRKDKARLDWILTNVYVLQTPNGCLDLNRQAIDAAQTKGVE